MYKGFANKEKVFSSSISFAIKNRSSCNGFWYCFYDEIKNIDSVFLKKPLKRKIIIINEETKEEKKYSKIADAAKEFNVNSGRICEAIKNSTLFLNHKWEYINN